MGLIIRLSLAGTLITLMHSGLAAFNLLSLDSGRLAALFGLCALVTGAVTALLYRLLRDDPEDDGGSGGSGGPPRDNPPPPPWWPSFERDFWHHVDGHDEPPTDAAQPPRRTPVGLT